MENYTFPFNSCEKPINACQPWSAFVTCGLCLVVGYYFLKARNFASKVFMFTLLIFNISHTLSHMFHIKGLIQFYATHFSAIASSIALTYLLQEKTEKKPNWSLLGSFYFIDLGLILAKAPHIYNIITFVFILMYIIYYFYTELDPKIQEKCKWIAYSSLGVLMFQILEILFCKRLLDWYPEFPFHVVVELSGVVPIYLLSETFYSL
jgi:hypothetical protein